MAKTIEPPILMSRILTFVLATSIVVLGTLVATLIKMTPLERPEVFFLFIPTRPTNVVLEPLTPEGNNKIATDNYLAGFIREYIIARNTLTPNAFVPKNNWAKVVKPWSSTKVFSDFANTSLYKEYSFSEQSPNISCSVNFSNDARDRAIVPVKESKNDIDNTYYVNFTWICENSGGQTVTKSYKIQIRIQSDLGKKASNVFENLEKLSTNPLGIQVVQYTVLGGTGDPLNSDVLSWSKN